MHIEMKQINKSFGNNRVLTGVNLELAGGEVLALLGENGAGKSTLMNILGGVLQPDGGEIHIDGTQVSFRKPADSLASDISFIHQELSLIVDLSIYENIFLGKFKLNRFGLLDHKGMIRETEALFTELDVSLDPKTLVRELDASYKQIVEIARAFHQNASAIIMDEPTAALTEPEVQRIFAIIRRLRSRNVGMIFISHKLNEVMEIADRYMVLRNGFLVAEGSIAETDAHQLSTEMVGHEIVLSTKHRQEISSKPVLELRGLSDNAGAYEGIDLTLYEGEILGVSGLLGDGRSELFASVFGSRPAYRGEILVHGKQVEAKHPEKMMREGVGYVPRDRKENGIIKDMSIMDNASITTWKKRSKHGVLDWSAIEAVFSEQVRDLDIRLRDDKALITTLSGGNQQKVVLAKWLAAKSGILIFDNPTQGVDVGAKEDIYEIIYKLAEQGISIVILSSEAREIIRLCDRCIVLFGGRQIGELRGEEMTEQAIMHLATGGALLDETGGRIDG